MALAKFTTNAAPAVLPVQHPSIISALVVNGETVATHEVQPDALMPDTRAPHSADIFRNEVLVATVYSQKSQEDANARAARWAGMLTAADVLTNGGDEV